MTTRILYVLANAHPGGAEKATVLMARGHDRVRYAATLLFLADGPLAATCRESGLEVVVHDAPLRLSRPAQLARAIRAVSRQIQERGIGLVHSCMPYAHLVAAPAAAVTATPACWFQHGPVGGRLDQLASLLPTRLVLANSAYTARRHAATAWRQHQLCVVPLGTDLVGIPDAAIAGWRVDVEGRFRLAPDQLVIGLMARFDPGKGIEFALAALAPLLRADPRRRVMIVGDTFRGFHPETKRRILAVVQQEAIDDRVIFAGEQLDVRPFLARMDLLVSPSLLPEAFGMVVIEAMAFGKPVLASDLGATPELVVDGETGWLFAAGDADGLRRRAADLLASVERRVTLGNAGRELARAKFSQAAFSTRLELAYDAILADRSRNYMFKLK